MDGEALISTDHLDATLLQLAHILLRAPGSLEDRSQDVALVARLAAANKHFEHPAVAFMVAATAHTSALRLDHLWHTFDIEKRFEPARVALVRHYCNRWLVSEGTKFRADATIACRLWANQSSIDMRLSAVRRSLIASTALSLPTNVALAFKSPPISTLNLIVLCTIFPVYVVLAFTRQAKAFIRHLDVDTLQRRSFAPPAFVHLILGFLRPAAEVRQRRHTAGIVAYRRRESDRLVNEMRAEAKRVVS